MFRYNDLKHNDQKLFPVPLLCKYPGIEYETRPRGYKTILTVNAHKNKTIKKFIFLGSDKIFFLLINVKMPTIVGILTFMARKISAELSTKSFFITTGPGLH